MRSLFQTLVLSFFLINSAVAQDEPANATNDNLATIYFYRLNSYMGSGVRMKIFADDQPIVRLKNASYYSYQTPAGEYFLSCDMGTKAKIKINVEPGKNYYIKSYIQMGYWSGNPQIELVDSIIGKSVIEGGALKLQEFEPISTIKPKSRIGLSFGGGVGIESIILFVDDRNNDVKLSTGGGFSIGAKYGYEFNKFFDLSADWLYQGSSLTPALKNAEATYGRMVLNLTPALIIPIKGGNYYRFKLGGGLGFYSLGKMYIDASDAGGEESTYKYKPALGPHASFIFESNFSDRGSMSLGIKYYNVSYDYTEVGSTHFSTERKIYKPDGSGFDFLFGYSYHF